MDKKLNAAIKKQYSDEYLRAALKDRPGRAAKMARWAINPMSRRSKIGVGILGTAEVGAVVGAAIVGGLVPAVLAIVAYNVLASPLNAPIAVSLFKTQRVANKAIEKDIANGTLVARYKAEVQDKQPPAAPESKTNTITGRAAKADFTAAADASKTTKPARKHWYSVKRQPKP